MEFDSSVTLPVDETLAFDPHQDVFSYDDESVTLSATNWFPHIIGWNITEDLYNTSSSSNDSDGVTHDALALPLQYWALILLIFPLLTAFGNILVCASVFRERSLQTVTNYFIVSLAVADILVVLLVMPLAVYAEVVNAEWGLGDILCDVWIALDVLSCTASILNLTAISVDRFTAVTRPIQYAKYKTSRRIYIMMGLPWFVSIAVSLPIILGMNYTEQRAETPTVCTFYNSDFLIYSSMTSFYIPCFLMLFLYWRICRVIRLRSQKTSVLSPPSFSRKATVNGSYNITITAAAPEPEVPITPLLHLPSPDFHASADRLPKIIEESAHVTSKPESESDKIKSEMTRTFLAIPSGDLDCKSHDDIAETDIIENPAVTVKLEDDVIPSVLNSESASQVMDDDYSEFNRPYDKVDLNVKSFQGVTLLSPPDRNKERNERTKNKRKLEDKVQFVTEYSFSTAGGGMLQKNGSIGLERKKRAAKRERKATKTLAIVLGVFLFCWVPFFTLNIINAVCLRFDLHLHSLSVCQVEPWLFSFLVWLGYINSFLNPIIYTIFNAEFRRAFRKLLFNRGLACR